MDSVSKKKSCFVLQFFVGKECCKPSKQTLGGMQTYRSTFHVYFQQTLLDALAVQQIIVLNYLRYIAKSHPCENCCFSETKLENSFTFEQSSSIKVHFPPMRTAQVK